MQLTRRRRAVTATFLSSFAALVLLTGSSCDPTPADIDAQNSAQNTGRLMQNQPVAAGKYSPTREQINNWNKTWQSQPGKLAYTYLFRQGVAEPLGYYVLIGPPVSYAANATQPYTPDCGISNCPLMANPGQDGAYYNQGAGTNQFYGTDAQSGRILEWGGDGISYLLSDQPLRLNAPPLGDAVIGQGKIQN